MGNFSKLSKPSSAKSSVDNTHKPNIQLKDNRPETKVQNKFSELVNSSLSEDSIQRVQNEEEELQMKEMEEEELQLKEKDEEELQMKSKDSNSEVQNPLQIPVQRVENNTGLPDQLKSGVENLSGYSLDDVNVHYNSAKPAQLNAHAYAQGTDIHIGPGQEQHLPHEAWHVVQQKQGRVRPTKQLKGKVNINDDSGLEKEADVMGAKALQMKSDHSGELISSQTGSVVQRDEATDLTDSRVNDLVKRVLQILSVLKTQGENWQEIYGKKGGELGKKGLQTAKDKVFGNSKKKGPSLKEKVIKEALKRWWGTLSKEDKLETLKESASLSTVVFDFFRGNQRGNNEDSERDQERANEKFDTLLTQMSLDDLDTFYETYKAYKNITAKVKEFENTTSELVEDLGSSVGEKVGELRTKSEFVSKFKDQKVPYKVAQLELKFLKDAIDQNRYHDELEALKDALEGRLFGPSAMISNPERFSESNQMGEAVETCSIAYDNLKMANILRNTSTSGLANVKNWFKEKKEALIGKSEQELQNTQNKQGVLVGKIQAVCNKSWYWFTKGVFTTKPKGVEKVGELLSGTDSNAEKLSAVRKHLVKPEEDLVATENRLVEVDESIKSSTNKLQKDVTVDNALSKTRTVKDTESFGNRNLDTSSKVANLGLEKVELEKKKSDLKKEIKGSGRHPLTQVFYNALKNLDPDNVISLGKTISIMDELASELENAKHTK
jgi:hypothetical protein